MKASGKHLKKKNLLYPSTPLPRASMLLLAYSRNTEQLLSLDKHWQLISWELTASATPTPASSTRSTGWRPRQQSLSLHRQKTTKHGSPRATGPAEPCGGTAGRQRDPRLQQPIQGGWKALPCLRRALAPPAAPRSPHAAKHPSPPAETPVCWGPEQFGNRASSHINRCNCSSDGSCNESHAKIHS